jgi:hypothetical protein
VIAVLCRSSHGNVAYPFDEDDQDVAGRFAAFLTAEVDPAEVVPFETVGPDASVIWLSPIKELLTWYETQHGKAVKQ